MTAAGANFDSSPLTTGRREFRGTFSRSNSSQSTSGVCCRLHMRRHHEPRVSDPRPQFGFLDVMIPLGAASIATPLSIGTALPVSIATALPETALLLETVLLETVPGRCSRSFFSPFNSARSGATASEPSPALPPLKGRVEHAEAGESQTAFPCQTPVTPRR